MSDAVESKSKTPWHVRLGQLFIAGCAAVGLKAAQKAAPPLAPPTVVSPQLPLVTLPAPNIPLKPPPSAKPGPSRYALRPSDVAFAAWAVNDRSKSRGDSLPTKASIAEPTDRSPEPPAGSTGVRVVHAPRAWPPRADHPLEIATAAEVDERLFLMRALETLYERWPVGVEGPRLQEELDALRHEAVRHRQYIKEREFDDRLAALYGDLIGLVDSYAECLARAGRIGREGIARAEREQAEGIALSSFEGGVLAGRALHEGASGGEALAAWAGTTLLGSLLDEMGKRPARDEAKRQALEANAREFAARYSVALATAEAAAIALTGRYGWTKGEAGFDTTPDEERQAADIVARGDMSGLIRLLEVARTRRPRDPFIRCATALQKSLSPGAAAAPEVLSAGADECLAAAALVPKGTFYDTYRADCLALAGLQASGAASAELKGRGWVAGPASRGPRALSIWRAYMAIDPRDPTGKAREQLAWALATTRRFAEAATTAAEVASLCGNDPDFAYGYACLLSLTGATGDSLRWVEHAFRDRHYPDILHAKTDPDLAAMRAREAAGFRALAEVKFAWWIDWGLFDHDDICLVNDSPFPLTGVRLDVTVDSKGSARWTESLTAERVEPGETYRWRTWVTSRGGGTKGLSTLRCDQNW